MEIFWVVLFVDVIFIGVAYLVNKDNAKYLMEIINQVNGDKITFQLLDSSSPSIIKDSNDKNTLYILMPMRV